MMRGDRSVKSFTPAFVTGEESGHAGAASAGLTFARVTGLAMDSDAQGWPPWFEPGRLPSSPRRSTQRPRQAVEQAGDVGVVVVEAEAEPQPVVAVVGDDAGGQQPAVQVRRRFGLEGEELAAASMRSAGKPARNLGVVGDVGPQMMAVGGEVQPLRVGLQEPSEVALEAYPSSSA